MRLEVKTFRDLKSIETIVDDWKELIERSSTYGASFLSPDWIIPWLESHQQIKPCFIAVYEGKRMVGLAPFQYTSKFHGLIQVLEPVAAEISYYGDILSEYENHDDNLNMILNYIRSQKLADLIRIDKVCRPAESHQSAMMNCALVKSRNSAAQSSLVLDINKDIHGEGGKSGVYKKLSRDSRNALRRLSKEGNVEVQICTDNVALNKTDIVKGMFWKLSGLRAKGVYSKYCMSPQSITFHNALAQVKQSNPSVNVNFAIKLDGATIAFNQILINEKTAFGHFMTHDSAYNRFSPGKILLASILEWLIENGYEQFDMLGYPEPYKENITNTKRPLFETGYPVNLAGSFSWLIGGLHISKRMKGIFYRMPLALRQTFVRFAEQKNEYQLAEFA